MTPAGHIRRRRAIAIAVIAAAFAPAVAVAEPAPEDPASAAQPRAPGAGGDAANDAGAGDDDGLGSGEVIVIVDTAPRERGVRDLTGADAQSADATRGLAEPVFVTEVRLAERAGETETVAEVAAESVGVRARSLGGLGAFSSISVRGAAPGNTLVLVDGVPLSQVASVTADLGAFELGAFERLDLYRGGVPAELGGAALGGALNLVSAVGRPVDGRRLRLSAGGGSFGARHLRARWLDDAAGGDVGYALGLGYAGAEGDFVYFNDNGTNLSASDDRFEARTNNGYDRADGSARMRWDRGGGTEVAAGVRALYKAQGIPGAASVQSERARLETGGAVADATATFEGALGAPALVARLRGFVAVERQRFRDDDGEVGLAAQDRRSWSLSAGAGEHLAARLGPHRLSAGFDARADYFADDNRGMDAASGVRLATSILAAADVALGDRVIVRPAVRVDIAHTDPIRDSYSPVTGEMTLPARTDLEPSPRLAARVVLADGVVAKASGGWYYRAPTVVELFGDRGFVVGNPGIASETGVSVDGGVVAAPAARVGPLDRLYAEVAGFARRSRDTIAFVPTAGLVTRAHNLGDTRARGVEARGSLRVARTATLTASYTLLDTEQTSSPVTSFEGKVLPHRPRHQGYTRIDVARAWRGRVGVVWADLSWTSASYLDPGNVNQVPARRLVGAGVKLEPIAGLLVGLEGKNLTDARVESIELDPPPRPDLTSVPRAVADFFGYPLPGRAFYVTLELHR